MTPGVAFACATCACGNPALTSIGGDQLFKNRLRFSTTVRAWGVDEGAPGVDAAQVKELRLDLSAAWAPIDRLALMMTVPFQARELTTISLARERALGLGDVELSARVVVLREQAMRPRFVISVIGGLRVPTAPLIRDRSGGALQLDAQLSAGAAVPMAGFSYVGFFSERWSAYGAWLGELPMVGRDQSREPPAARLSLAGQFQPVPWLGLRAGLEARLEGDRSVAATVQRGSGGLTAYAAPDVIFSVQSRWLLALGVRVPFVTTVSTSRPWPVALASVTVDL